MKAMGTMTSQTVTIELPLSLYQRLQARAAQTHRSVEAEARETLANAVQAADTLSDDLESSLAALALLSDAELWQAGRTRLPEETAAQLERLHFKQQREGLTRTESETNAVLLHQTERVMLIRAQAAVLLKQRGHDVAELGSKP